MKAVVNAKAILVDKYDKFFIMDNSHILFEEKIQKIYTGDIPSEIKNLAKENVFDAKGKYISPGFINIHAHGAMGADAMDEVESALEIFGKAEASMGVTSFLPTTMTYDIPRLHGVFKRIRTAMQKKSAGARILGAHIEGPYINPKKCGAQDPKHIKRAEFKDIEDFLDAIKIITLAPELTDDDFMRKATEHGILLSMGHSEATYEEALNAIESGCIRHITHIFNAMPPFHHRNPGIIGAAFDTPVKTELIADNVHSSPTAQRLIYKVKGIGQIILITDSIRASCLGDGLSELGGQKVFVKGDRAVLENGALAGSVAKMNGVIRIFKENTGIKLEETIEAAAKNPAQSLNIYDKTGSITEGKAADLTLFDDNLKIALTVVGGEVVFESKN